MAPHHVLILGGHGKVAQILTGNLVRRSWNVTSVIRTAEQIPEIKSLGEGHPGAINVLVRSLEDVKSDAAASAVLEESKPDMVVFSAGAGGEGPAERTFLIDRDAACHFIRASAARPSITRFVMISYLGSRRTKPSWWNKDSWAAMQEINTGILAKYYQAKVVADEELFKESKKQGSDFAGISLRPGTLTTEPKGGVMLGKTPVSSGTSSRESVAATAEALLAADGVKTSWVDMLDGEEDIESAVKRVIAEGVDAIEGFPTSPTQFSGMIDFVILGPRECSPNASEALKYRVLESDFASVFFVMASIVHLKQTWPADGPFHSSHSHEAYSLAKHRNDNNVDGNGDLHPVFLACDNPEFMGTCRGHVVGVDSCYELGDSDSDDDDDDEKDEAILVDDTEESNVGSLQVFSDARCCILYSKPSCKGSTLNIRQTVLHVASLLPSSFQPPRLNHKFVSSISCPAQDVCEQLEFPEPAHHSVTVNVLTSWASKEHEHPQSVDAITGANGLSSSEEGQGDNGGGVVVLDDGVTARVATEDSGVDRDWLEEILSSAKDEPEKEMKL
ncbi:hypothetical protein MKZ38_008133 [Zalerion maritima]|uniref:NAD(P)-binding domain-containing protein n=1 Tax=Zalerion maritima TaxID=339359 RepID=A0AAD5RHC1_9PEZI|nr:hypothetical protein MKZ38_008133 [Zalerion maritima]